MGDRGLGRAGRSLIERLACAPDVALRDARIAALSPAQRKALLTDWEHWRRDDQEVPDGDWRVWLLLAGRGYGKTRVGAEWVRRCARHHGDARIAIVGATLHDARSVMVEGDSGVLAVCRGEGERPLWEPSLRRLCWPNGARAFVYSAAEPDGLRGPQHSWAWADEIAKWEAGEAAWDNLMLGLRCGPFPRALATTTPKPVPLVRRLANDRAVKVTRRRTADNRAQLPPGFVEQMAAAYGATWLGRQELEGELIEDVEGALWTRGLIEASRVLRDAASTGSAAPQDERGLYKRIVIGVDPPASAGGTCGIVACALGADEVCYVLGDHSVAGRSPEGWARAVVTAYERHEADRVVVEKNQGGDMVESVLRNIEAGLPTRGVHASRGKTARAEPVAALFENGRAKFAGVFRELEDELAGMCAGGSYQGPGRSPDRADAMVWALTELTRPQRVPRIIAL